MFDIYVGRESTGMYVSSTDGFMKKEKGTFTAGGRVVKTNPEAAKALGFPVLELGEGPVIWKR